MKNINIQQRCRQALIHWQEANQGNQNMQIISNKFFMSTFQRNLNKEAEMGEIKVVIKQKIELSDRETALRAIFFQRSIFQTA